MSSQHVGVRVWQKKTGGTFYLFWRDPRFEKKQRNDSSETTDFEIATRIAMSLSRLIYNKEFWTDLPDGIHPQAQKIWGSISLSRRIASARMRVAGEQFQRDGKGGGLSNAARDRSAMTAEEVDDLLTRMKIIAQERDQYRDECRRLSGLLQKMGSKAMLDSEPKTYRKAMEEFFASRKKPGQWTDILRDWYERLGREYGMEENIHDLTPQFMIDHINKKGGKADTRRKLCNNLCMFLRKSSKSFDEATVKTTIIGALEVEDEAWFWLTREQSLGIISELAKQADGQYWADLAMIQYACGFRGEEMVILRTENSKEIGGHWQITVARIFDDKGRQVRRIKTTKSAGAVRVPQMAVPALLRRREAGGELLFPMYTKNLVRPSLYDAQTRFERKLALWPSADDHGFSDAYTARLRKAAAIADPTLDMKKIGARTFRRTCARELVLAHGFEKAAAVLRDSIEILRRHYADLESSDVPTER